MLEGWTTLKIVAKYADACNLFGSAETVKRKLNILKEHCMLYEISVC
jgi:hypothetical protein